MDDNKILITLRDMAWERAKGELEAMKRTFWTGNREFYDEFCETIDKFYTKIEDELGI